MSNPPDAGAAALWQTTFPAPAGAVPAIEAAFGDFVLAVSAFEDPDDPQGPWQVQLLTAHAPDAGEFAAVLAEVAARSGFAPPLLRSAPLEDRDWVAEGLRHLKPIAVRRFHVAGSHDRGTAAAGRIDLIIDAAQAFGTGHHETTASCLLAIDDWLRRRRRHGAAMLDVGTGTGILALALARSLHRPVAATDIDPLAVATARANARANLAGRWVRPWVAVGFAGRALKGRRFDLIVANILAGPLAHMAPQLARRLSPGGEAILSGLLRWQEAEVVAAYRRQGVALERRVVRGNWSTLVMRRRLVAGAAQR